MGHRGAMRGNEIEAFSRWARRCNRWRSGERAALKAFYNRRQRRRAKRDAWVECEAGVECETGAACDD